MDRPGGKPIIGAKVRVYSEWTHDIAELQTDREGAYRFVPHVPGPYRLMVVARPAGVWAEGVVIYVTDDPGKYPTGKTSMIRINQGEFCEIKDLPPGRRADPDYTVEAAVVVPGLTRRLPDLHLTLPQCISGTVRDESSRPVPGATIRFLAAAMARCEIETDSNGQYRIYPSPRGVPMNCYGTSDRYYPVEPSGSRCIRVLPGQEVGGTDFGVVSAPKVTGEVVFPGGKKAQAGMDVWVQASWRDPPRVGFPLDGSLSARVETDAQGNFVAYLRHPFGAKVQKYQRFESVLAVAWSPDWRMGGSASLAGPALPGPGESLKIDLKATGTATVGVVAPDGRPVAGAKIVTWPGLRGRSHFAAKWALPFEDLGEGRYRITRLIPNLPHRYYVQADGFRDDHPGDHKPIIVSSGEQVEAEQVKLSLWGKDALPRLMEFADRDQGAIHSIGELGPDAAPAVAKLTEILKASPDKENRRLAAQALGRIGPATKGTVGELISAMENDDPEVARYAAEALGLIGDLRAAAAIEAARKSARIDPQTAAVALWRLKLAARTPAPSTVSAPETPASPAATQPALRQAAEKDIANIAAALNIFEIDTGRYPTTAEGLAALLEKAIGATQWKGPYIRGKANDGKISDPWSRPYVYRCPGKGGPNGFDLLSLGPDGKEGTADDVRGKAMKTPAPAGEPVSAAPSGPGQPRGSTTQPDGRKRGQEPFLAKSGRLASKGGKGS